MKLLKVIATLLVLVVLAEAVVLYLHHTKVNQANEQYQAYNPRQLDNFGSTSSLAILPLVNWHTASANLKGEMGVSYLVQTDSLTMLFDLGHNAKERDPSPLQHNMNALGISLEEIDIIFISHNHFDHVGGKKWIAENSFSLGLNQVNLTGKKVYTPVPLTYPDISPEYIPDPTVISTGVASIGTIPRKLFMGWIDEQALVVNVAGKGLVIIVGCGHQTLPKIIERTRAVFDEPIFGIVGDLHYPVPDGRLTIAGLNAQRFFASGKGQLNQLTLEDVHNRIDLLKSLNLGLVALGGHDSSDQVIGLFADTFDDAYAHVRVGEWIRVASPDSIPE